MFIFGAVLDGFGNVELGEFGVVFFIKIGDCSGYFYDFEVGAGGERETGECLLKKLLSARTQWAVFLEI